jgi:hypothetical protein
MKHSKMNLQTALLFAALALPTLVVPAFAQDGEEDDTVG